MAGDCRKGLNINEIKKVKKHIDLLREIDGSPFLVNMNGRTRLILVNCSDCGYEREVRLVDFLYCKTTLCGSCSKKGDLNPAKQDYVRAKLSRKGVKDISYLTPEWRHKFSESRKGKRNPNFGNKYTDETRKKQRIATIKNIEKRLKNGGQLTPAYNIEACKMIDEYGKQNGYNFQHAENGGEFYIKELGYWVDGYDKENNIVLEIDEDHHFDSFGNLKTRDVKRQNEIEEFLNCKFIRLENIGE